VCFVEITRTIIRTVIFPDGRAMNCNMPSMDTSQASDTGNESTREGARKNGKGVYQ